MFVEGSSSAPRDGADADRFAAELRTAAAAGAKVVRIVMLGGRRYETFQTAAAFREFADKAWKSMQLAAPLAAKHGVRLAVENHKDWRADELLDGLKRLDSEHVGACIDTGNNIALLEDPAETVKTLAPAAMSVHLKDMAVRPYDDGFLLAEVPLGEGLLDLPAIVATVKQARPEVRFSLEMMTRDPLRVPCLTEKYWATFAAVSGRDLARMLRWVRDKAAPQPLPQIGQLPLREQFAREEENVRKCLKFAAERLRL
jgi:sugar phosphate isomerase/epimerase